KRRLDVDVERLVKHRLGKFVSCPDWKDAGVVDEDVHLGGALGECAHIVGRLEISAHELRLATAGLDRGDHLCATRLAPAADQDTRSFARERFRRRATDAGSATGDQSSLSAKLLHSFSPLSMLGPPWCASGAAEVPVTRRPRRRAAIRSES